MRIVLVLVASILVAGYVEASLDAQQYGAPGGGYGGDKLTPAQRLKAGLFGGNDNDDAKDGDYSNKDYNKDYNNEKPAKTVTKTVTEREQGEVVEKTVKVTETVHDRKTVTVRGDAETVTVTKTKRGHVETVTETVHDVETVTKTKTKWRDQETKTKWRTTTVTSTKTVGGGSTVTSTTTKFKNTTTVTLGTLGTLTTTSLTFSTFTSTSFINGATITISVTQTSVSVSSVPQVTVTTIESTVSTSSVAPPSPPTCGQFTSSKGFPKDFSVRNDLKFVNLGPSPSLAKCQQACCDSSPSDCKFITYIANICILYSDDADFASSPLSPIVGYFKPVGSK